MKIVSRKAQRKAERQEKKKKKLLYYQRKGRNPNEEEKTTQKKVKFLNSDKDDNDIVLERSPKQTQTFVKRNKSREVRERERKAIQEEERAIRKYERLLRLKSYRKRNKLPKSFYLDGLGSLIELCDSKTTDSDLKKDRRSRSEPEELSESEMDSNDDTNDEDEQEEELNNDNGDSDDEQEDIKQAGEDSDQGMDEEEINNQEVDKFQQKRKKPKSEYYEDIYGFIRDKDGNIVQTEEGQKRRDLAIAEVTVDENLQRKIRGLINRLTSSNIKVISREIIEMYKSNSRHVVNKAILNCINNLLIGAEQSVPCKLVSEIAMLIAILYFETGDEVGGYFIHSILSQFDSILNDSLWQTSKKLNNVVVFILNLYATGLVDPQLIYDILDKFCERFACEKSIEIIDLVLKTSGFMLRKDDAAKMKSLIVNIQTLSTSVESLKQSGSRIKFILESLTAIKNNNVAKLKSTDTVVMNELIESTLRAVIKKTRVSSIPGQYTAVIQSAHWFSFTKEMVPLEAINSTSDATNQKSDPLASLSSNIDYDLRDKLCRALRINTPLRRDLFTALFVCNNYLDAAVKLITIGKKQFSEVINVVLHVAIHEKAYNKFYHHLLQHLTTCDRKYKLALDFAIRDKITDLESLSSRNKTNLEKLMVELLKDNSLVITCLKVVQFSDMNEAYVGFIRNILQPILAENETIISSVLSKIPKKDNFASAIKLFISCFMDPESNIRASNIKELQFKLKI